MKEEIRHLQLLHSRVLATWELLRIPEMMEKMEELGKEMQKEGFWQNPEEAKKISQSHEALRSEAAMWSDFKKEVEDLLALAEEVDAHPDEELAQDIVKKVFELVKKFEELEFFLLLNGKHDSKNALVAFHAGSGGTEAQDWAEMLRRMIVRYAERKGWTVTILDESWGQEAGIKSAFLRIEGRYAFGHLKSEHGTHRLVRISPFDAEHMRHTSFAQIEIIPEVGEESDVVIDPTELRIDTYRSGGAGGQHVNKTDSAVRITHIPSGIVVQCQNERSQHQNKEAAMKILRSKLQLKQEEEEEEERLKLRGEYKSAEWGNQIRSYVLHPYKLVKDVRTKYEETDPEKVLNGEIDGFIENYLRWIKI